MRTAKILKCLKTEGIQLLADLGSGFHSLGISQWPLLLILHMPLSKGFLFWHLWSFEVSYGSQAMIMIMLITYSTLKQHIYNNQLILIRISEKWINKFLWSFITSPWSLYLSYRSQSCTLTLSTMKKAFGKLYMGNSNVLFFWSDTGTQTGGEICPCASFVTRSFLLFN